MDRELSSWQRHQRLVHGYQQTRSSKVATSDHEILAKHHRFVLSVEEEGSYEKESWETRMAKKYYTRLFREYALVDLSYYKSKKLGLRWRRESEVVSGKGQFSCANVTPTKKCDETAHLHSFELNFAYVEHGVSKNELVKVRLCPRCAKKMNQGRSGGDDEGKKRKSHTPKVDKKRRVKKSSTTSDDGCQAAEPPQKALTEVDAESTPSSEAAVFWDGDAPKDRSEEDEMDEYLQGLFL